MSRSPERSLESTFRDGSPDKIASQTMAREANSLAIMGLTDNKRESQNLKFDQAGKYEFLNPESIMRNKHEKINEPMANRDKVSFVSAAFCNPLFLVGMGAAFAVLDDLKQAREARLADAIAGINHGDTTNSIRRQADSDRQEQAADLLEETEEQKRKRFLLEATSLIGAGAASEKSILGSTEKSILKNAMRNHQIKKEMREKMREKLLSGLNKTWDEKATQRSVINWLKSNKLFKHKMKLENQIEKARGKEGLSFVSNLNAKLEEVDKALKQAGA